MSSALANALGYVITVLLARGLAPADFGAIGALFSVGVVGTIPATAIQLAVAKRTVQARGRGETIDRRSAALPGLALGAGLTTAFAVAALPLSHYLHLDHPMVVAVVGFTLLPMLLTSALQGLLLGNERFGALSMSTLFAAVSRLAAVPVALALGGEVLGILVAIAAGAVLTAAITYVLIGARGAATLGMRSLTAATVKGSVTLAAYFLLTNVDVPIARHVLTPNQSGAYVLASLFTKICLWGPQFLSVIAFPRIAADRHGSRATVIACGLTAAMGGVGVLVLMVLAGPLLIAVSGSPHEELTQLAGWFGLLGVLWAVLHTVVLHEVANFGARSSWWIWVAAVSLIGAASTLQRPVELATVLTVTLAVTVLTVLVGLGRTVLLRRDRSVLVGNPVRLTAEELLSDGNQYP